MKRICPVLLLMLAFSLTAWAQGKKTETMRLTVFADEEIVIGLDANPTTGYSWVIDNSDDIQKLTLISDEFVSDSADYGEKKTGAPGKQVFIFRAVEGASGKETARFSYRRPWENKRSIAPVKETVVEVTIK